MESLFIYPLIHNQYGVMVQLKARIKEDVALIPKEMAKAASMSTKKRETKLVECRREAFKGRRVVPGLTMLNTLL